MKCRMLLTVLVLLACEAYSQPVLVKRDNGIVRNNYIFSKYGIEESVVLPVDGPCNILEVQIYYRGKAGLDTLYIASDPSEGTLPPTSFVWGYSLLTTPKIFNYNGTPGWYTIDLRPDALHAEGYDRITIQHRLREKALGPCFAYDNDGIGTTYTSFYMNPYESFFPVEYGIAGKMYATAGDYMVRLLVEYDYPNDSTSLPPPNPTFPDVTVQTGIVGGTGAVINSDRASIADWNGDGWDDIAIGATLFQNRGDGTFANVSSTAALQAGATAWCDVNNDGRPDVFAANSWGTDKLYINNGDGTYTDATKTSTIFNNAPTQTPVWLDYDNDGLPDLFIANSRKEENGVETYYQDQLWHNNGNNVFSNVTQSCGIAAVEQSPYYDCYGAAAVDYNNDGLTDIFVANYRLAPDFLYKNNGNGKFTNVGAITGVQGADTQNPSYFGHGMGCEWGDYDNDGWMDLAVGNLAHPSDSRGLVSNPSLIFHNSGSVSQKFTEVHQTMGLKFKEMNAGVCWGDFDCDGYLDVWHGQISYYDKGSNGEPMRPGRLYFNQGPPDYELKDVTWFAGLTVHGPWTAERLDFDHDGDLDLLVCSSHEGVRLYRSDTPRKGDWLEVKLTGSPADRVCMDAWGSKVSVYLSNGQHLTRELAGSAAGSRATQHSSTLHFGLGQAASIDSMIVSWPNGTRRIHTGIAPNHLMTVAYDGSISVGIDAATPPAGWAIQSASFHNGHMRFDLSTNKPLSGMKVEVFNSLGQSVAAAFAQNITAGVQYVQLSGLPPHGIFFVRFTAERRVQTMRLAR